MFLDLEDEKLFGNLAGEDDTDDISTSFYDDLRFKSFYDDSRRLSIVSARKGVGKSALLSFLDYRLNSDSIYNKPLIIRTTGTDLQGLGDFNGKDHVFLENHWKQIICKKIIIALGAEIGIALKSNTMSMVEMSELDGYKAKNLVGGLLSRLKLKIKGNEVVTQNSIPENNISVLDKYLDTNANQNIWLLIDDIDSKYKNNEDFQNRVGSFFSAIRSLTNEFSNLRIRATVRTDVWSCLSHLEDLDKVEQYVFKITWNNRAMRLILAQKILSYIQTNHETVKKTYQIERDYNKLIEMVFKSPIDWNGKSDSHVFDAINAFSNRRPRWMLQLCRMSALKTKEVSLKNRKIELQYMQYILLDYGRNRRDDLIKEHKHQFSEIEQLIDSFRATEKEFKYTDITSTIKTKFIRGRDTASIPVIDGNTYIDPEDLAHFLYKIGLISMIHDRRDKFTHFDDDPDLFKSVENRNGHLNWSIHPAYRDFLNIR